MVMLVIVSLDFRIFSFVYSLFLPSSNLGLVTALGLQTLITI